MMSPARGLTLCAALLTAACDTLPLPGGEETEIVYALGSREAFTSPLQAALKPVDAALEFDGHTFALNGAQMRRLDVLAESWRGAKPRYLVAGYTPPNLPADFARAISERRAQAVRQHLIEKGVEAANVQTVGFGPDAGAAGSNSHVVVIYEQP
jgi:outer membrane protein OmpA-like peptidoglycan-associated protein